MTRGKHKRTGWLVPRGTKCGSKGSMNRRIIARHVEGGKEYRLHATKGYRAMKA